MIAFCISTAHLLYTGICMELAGGGGESWLGFKVN